MVQKQSHESQRWQVSLVTRDTDVTANIEEFHVKNSREEKLLGVKIGGKPKVTCTRKGRKFYGSSKT